MACLSVSLILGVELVGGGGLMEGGGRQVEREECCSCNRYIQIIASYMVWDDTVGREGDRGE